MAFIVRQMRPQEASFAIDCAAAEGWNPGDHDAVSFYHADPDGFFVGELDGELIGCIAAVSYGDFGFIGLYIVIPDSARSRLWHGFVAVGHAAFGGTQHRFGRGAGTTGKLRPIRFCLCLRQHSL